MFQAFVWCWHHFIPVNTSPKRKENQQGLLNWYTRVEPFQCACLPGQANYGIRAIKCVWICSASATMREHNRFFRGTFTSRRRLTSLNKSMQLSLCASNGSSASLIDWAYCSRADCREKRDKAQEGNLLFHSCKILFSARFNSMFVCMCMVLVG